MYLNTVKAVEFINKLEMIKSNNDVFNNFELKFLRQQEEDNQKLRVQLQEHVEQFDDEYLYNETEQEHLKPSTDTPPRPKIKLTETGSTSLKKPIPRDSAGPGSGMDSNVLSASDNEGGSRVRRRQADVVVRSSSSNNKRVIVRGELNEGGEKMSLTALGQEEQKKKELKDHIKKQAKKQFDDQNKVTDNVYYFGPSSNIFRFSCRRRTWDKIASDYKNNWKGQLKHTAVCPIYH